MRELTETLIMTTCKCRESQKDALVMTRNYLENLLEARENLTKTKTITEVIELLQTHQNLWFSQSLNIGSGAFWANKAQTTQALITEIRKITK
jgi:hypothetical protein